MITRKITIYAIIGFIGAVTFSESHISNVYGWHENQEITGLLLPQKILKM
jgi:hypothetical protein